MKEWKKELCNAFPEEVQQLSRDTVIQRRDITPFERESIEGETEYGWECECRILTKEEYSFVKMQEEIIENQLTLMSAVADVYEMQGGL